MRTYEELAKALGIHGSHRKAAKALGIAQSTFTTQLKKLSHSDPGIASQAKPPSAYESTQSTKSKNGFLLEVRSLHRIKTAAEAMEKGGIDPDVWEPVKVVANSWEVVIKQDDGSPKTCPLWQIKVTCARRVPESIEESVDALAKRIVGGKFKWPTVHISPPKQPTKMFMGLVDHHFAKLCWAPETRNNYDLKVATDLFARAIRYTCRKSESQLVDEIIFPIGNDYCHIDTRAGTTERGTQLEYDGRYEKMSGVAEESAIKGVEEARKYAKVRVVWVGGNHDPVTSMWICRVLNWAFEGDKNVTVDTSPSPHKYYGFGRCLLGMAHGDAPKEKSLKDMMPVEEPELWAKATECREWLTGHMHQQKKTERIGTSEQAGQVFRILPSLCGTDSWHYRNGFCMSRKATESYIYSSEYGMESSIHASARRLLEMKS